MRKVVNDTFDEVFNEDNEGVISEIDLEDLITERVGPQNMTELIPALVELWEEYKEQHSYNELTFIYFMQWLETYQPNF